MIRDFMMNMMEGHRRGWWLVLFMSLMFACLAVSDTFAQTPPTQGTTTLKTLADTNRYILNQVVPLALANDTRIKALQAQVTALQAQDAAQKAAINAVLADARNGNCNFNGLVSVLAQWSTVKAVGAPAITYDPDTTHWVACADRTKPAPKLPAEDLP